MAAQPAVDANFPYDPCEFCGEAVEVQDEQVETVLEVRRRFQATMRDDLVAAVEDLTGREVAVFMSENHVDPDVALETFVLEPVAGDKDAFHPRGTDAGET